MSWSFMPLSASEGNAVELQDDTDEETSIDVDEVDSVEESESDPNEIRVLKRKKYGRIFLRIVYGVGSIVILCGILLIVLPSRKTPKQIADELKSTQQTNELIANARTKVSIADAVSFGAVIGEARQFKLEALILVFCSWVCTVGATMVATHVVFFHPEIVAEEFDLHPTIAIASKDVHTPAGRIYTVAMFTSSILKVASGYTFWLYPEWGPMLNKFHNPMGEPIFQDKLELRLRTMWLVIPNVAAIFVSTIPILRDARTFESRTVYEGNLTKVHQICYPLFNAATLIMETIQLAYGESAFRYFFSSEPVPTFGAPISPFQRTRVVLLSLCWIATLLGTPLQAFFFYLRHRGGEKWTSYRIALFTFYVEVAFLWILSALPTIAGVQTLWQERNIEAMSEGYRWIAWLDNIVPQ